ncbi:MAG: glutamate racemase [Lachnospiraceae bacterium]|nr:glutamate racemase [Lachnospiraceae bacterium]
MNQEPIGVFDSGVGGLTVTREIMRQLPEENLVYFGDTARVPYGSKSKQTIIRYSTQITNFLKTKNVKAIVIACNTASALALESIAEKVDIPVIGVVWPGAIAAAEATKTKNIGVIGTAATIKSKVYNRYLHQLNPEITVVTKACPLFAPLVEEGLVEDRVTDDIANRYLGEFKDYNVDALVLGCTHYPLLSNTIRRTLGDKIKLVNPAYETAKSLKEMLISKKILNTSGEEVHHEYYVSDMTDQFTSFADRVLPFSVDKIRVVNIEKYEQE